MYRQSPYRSGHIDNSPTLLMLCCLGVVGFNIFYGETLASIWWNWPWWLELLTALIVGILFIAIGELMGLAFLVIFIIAAMFIQRPELPEQEPAAQPSATEAAEAAEASESIQSPKKEVERNGNADQ